MIKVVIGAPKEKIYENLTHDGCGCIHGPLFVIVQSEVGDSDDRYDGETVVYVSKNVGGGKTAISIRTANSLRKIYADDVTVRAVEGC